MESRKYITIYLKPGEIYASADPIIIKTVLGSCIAVCLHDKVNKVGGTNHYLLPQQKDTSSSACNYGEHAIPELIDLVVRQGGNDKYLVAQLVGGGCSRVGSLGIGRGNIDIARELLARHRIPIIREDVGGDYGRVVRFFPHSNELEIHRAGTVATTKPATNEKFVQLTTVQADFLRQAATSGLERAQQSLTTMLGVKDIELSVSEVMLRKMTYVQDYLSRNFSDFVVGTGQKDSGPVGEVVMMMAPGKTAMWVNSLLRRPLDTNLQYDRMETSTIIELSNIVINAILGTLANHLGFAMMLRVPNLIRSNGELATTAFMNGRKRWKLSLAIKTKVHIPTINLSTLLLLLVEIRTISGFFDKLGQ